ncbi:hypothetical protein [Mycoplasmopsis primatum]|uniref:hypothetical protein n=1 Tax=Mycoplasmopsis primatum TaxID=55604 RepID=UPI000ADD6EC8|nr:hypothetical protein [Mycoplasmopsis primatum]
MYEYRIESCRVANAEGLMNKMAKYGWRVIAVSPNIAMGYGLVITFERSTH